ncbi:MAG: MFS transporter [Candidatus Kapaibacterium sp.]
MTLPTEALSSSYRWKMYILCWVVSMFAGVASTLMSLYLSVAVKDLTGVQDAQMVSMVGSYVSSLFLIGWTIGGIGLGIIADKIGRVRSLMLAIFLYTFPTAMAGFAHSWEILVVCRFLTGAGIGATLVVTTTFIAEIWKNSSRATALGILANSYAVGIVSAGVVNYCIADWRTAFWVSSLPIVMIVVVAIAMKDTALWQSARSAAGSQRSQIATLTNSDNRRNFIVASMMFGTMLVGLWATFSWLPTWIQSLLSGETNGQKERGIAMMLLGLGGIVGTFFAGFLSTTLGRKKPLLISFLGCFLASILLYKTNTVLSGLIFIEVGILSLFFGLSQGVMTNYIPELFPTIIRGTATGFCFNIGRIVTAIAVFFVGMIVVTLGGYHNAVFVFSYAYLLGFIVIFFAKETKDAALPI